MASEIRDTLYLTAGMQGKLLWKVLMFLRKGVEARWPLYEQTAAQADSTTITLLLPLLLLPPSGQVSV